MNSNIKKTLTDFFSQGYSKNVADFTEVINQ